MDNAIAQWFDNREREREKLTLCLIREKRGNKSTYGDKEERNM